MPQMRQKKGQRPTEENILGCNYPSHHSLALLLFVFVGLGFSEVIASCLPSRCSLYP
jgi:hypothetical protein